MIQTRNKSIATKLTAIEQDEIKKLIDAGIFLNNSDFVRQAIRDKLNEYKVINIREIPKPQAKKEIKQYMEQHNTAYVSEIAEDLELDLDLVFNLVDELEKENQIEETGN
ncbi:MAG: ribbon-helix-helix domain-containing protein [Methanobacteriaceae archaeon]|jgi:Arc/MetJ-type ribon-helix-helix transcriptional regulator|nr:ribbon-helix-helix domain-containing protein [Methanobacteriaceae archaeon]